MAHRGPVSTPGRGFLRSLVTLVVAWGLLPGCGDHTSVGPRVAEEGSATVVSLSPAITTTMVDLGETDRLVGRTPWCRGIDDRPVVGTLEGVDAEILVALQPGVVLHQPPASGTDPVLVGLQERLGFRLGGGRLDGVRDLLVLLDQIEGMELAAPDRIRQRRLSLEAIGACEIPDEAPGAVLLYSVDSVGVAGEDTYLGELGRAAGLRNLAGPGGWREWSIEMLLSAEADVVIAFTTPEMESFAQERLAAIEWLKSPAIAVITNPNAFEPSTRMPEVLAELRRGLEEAGVTSAGADDGSIEGEVERGA
ncbi:MAG: hypothetical protein CMJ34_01170 [Phycisphaerae bacterium]|nr:hypothetical protein [Phycisphaerae bacterium]